MKNLLQRSSHPLQCISHKHSPLYTTHKTMHHNHVNRNSLDILSKQKQQFQI
jgi:hypothetical protein